MTELTIYGRPGCHLCEEMQEALQALLGGRPVAVRVVDISGNAELEARFSLKIPVLMAGKREICHYVLDRDALQAYLDEDTGIAVSPN